MPDGSTPAIQNETVRVRALRHDDLYYLEFDVRRAGGDWRVVLATGLATIKYWRTDEPVFYSKHPLVQWKADGGELQTAAGLFDEIEIAGNGR